MDQKEFGMEQSVTGRKRVGVLLGMMAVVLGLSLLGLLDGELSAQDAKSQAVIEKAFPSSSKCKRCHERVFEEWETSPLSKSIHSPAFRASLDAYLNSSAGKDKAMCFRCHAP
ncbi:MAG: multiheme c-type cytochrome, partial [Nitrospirota bacterium]